jgi:phosphoglycolate phosphatase-like HAD superfamily hydrolase
MNTPIIYALDFDGVICDSAIETAISGWKAACRIWPEMSGPAPAELIESFRQVRPIIETGFEAILTMRQLFLGSSVESIYSAHKQQFAALKQQAHIDDEQLKALFGDTRDCWIAADQQEWALMNPLFSGVAEKLQRLQEGSWYVITTKQERFVKEIFAANAIELGDERLFGLDRKLSKVEVLKWLRQRHPDQPILFVEDRLPTLVNVANEPELAEVELLFALWGYNTQEDKASALAQGFRLQQLAEFLG